MCSCAKSLQAGFGLFETLLSLAIMSVLLLSISAFQIKALFESRIQVQRTTAIGILANAVDDYPAWQKWQAVTVNSLPHAVLSKQKNSLRLCWQNNRYCVAIGVVV